MATHLHTTGEEAILRDFFTETITKPSSMSIGLFDDSSSGASGTGMADGDNVSNLVEPTSGTEYQPQTKQFGTTDITEEGNGNGNRQIVFTDTTFQTGDASSGEVVDAYYVTIVYQSNEEGQSSAQENLLFTGDLDQQYDLGQISQFTLSGAGLAID